MRCGTAAEEVAQEAQQKHITDVCAPHLVSSYRGGCSAAGRYSPSARRVELGCMAGRALGSVLFA